MIIHTVLPGETLFSISKEYNLTSDYLQAINQLPNPQNLVVGQSIIILFPETEYTAEIGDTIYSIANNYGITVVQLLRNNPYLSQRQLQPGDKVIISFTDKPLKDTQINGYTYPNVSLSYLRTVMPYLTYISVFTSGFQEDGTLILVDDEEIISLAQTFGVAALMHLSTLSDKGRFDSSLAVKLLSNEVSQNVLIENILQTLTSKNYYGLDLDFEFVPGEYKEAYVSFVAKLTKALNDNGFIVIVALAPKTSDNQPGRLYEGHDYKGLGNASNLSFIMTYEWGYTYGPPMAVAPLDKVTEVLSYAVKNIPPQKILMGIPTYGYLWNLPYVRGESRATSISNITATEIAAAKNVEIFLDQTAMSPYYYFMDDNERPSVVWFEDAKSIEAKLRLIKNYGIAGAGYWNLDRPFPQNWMVLNALYNILQVPVVLSQ